MKPEDSYVQVKTALNRVLSVSEARKIIADCLGQVFPYNRFTIFGEVSRSSMSQGTLYFDLKDSNSSIACAISQKGQSRCNYLPQVGHTVQMSGTMFCSFKSSAIIYASTISRTGSGDLHQQLELLKQKLKAEGLFKREHKRPLPKYPRLIGVATSQTGAVIHDITKTLKDRNNSVQILLVPCIVQGSQAPVSIVRAIERLDAIPEVDCIIVGRGGGSFEDLMAFQSEEVVRAVYNCSKPVVSAVGHESDVSLCDLAADLRAPTPTAAAQAVAPAKVDLQRETCQLIAAAKRSQFSRIALYRSHLARLTDNAYLKTPLQPVWAKRECMHALLERADKTIDKLVSHLKLDLHHMMSSVAFRFPKRLLNDYSAELGGLKGKLLSQLGSQQQKRYTELRLLQEKLEALSPWKVLGRGYALVKDEHGHLVTGIKGTSPNHTIFVQLRDGCLEALVKQQVDAGAINPETSKLY